MDTYGYSKGALADHLEDNKFTIISCDTTISNKTNTKQQRPCHAYIEINLNKENESSFFSYLVFQNFYTAQITIKQFNVNAPGDIKEAKKEDKNWLTILKNYHLMRNAHFETDAQNWHIIGSELFNSKFDRRNLKSLRIYLKQPSPSWVDYTLRSIQVYMKKTDYSGASGAVGVDSTTGEKVNAFDMMKQKIQKNLKGLRKDSSEQEQTQEQS